MKKLLPLTLLALVSITPLQNALAHEASFESVAREGRVRWVSWSTDLLKRSEAEKKPIYLFVGTVTNELGRAMDKQSFVNEKVAALLNEHFICVIVDRDEHPEVAAYVQAYLQAAKQTQGWPANVWLAANGKPFEGSTYLPPSEEWGKEGIQNVLQRIVNSLGEDSSVLEYRADEGYMAMEAYLPTEPLPAWEASRAAKLRDSGIQSWLTTFDAQHGGFGEAPRYPEPELLIALLRHGGESKDAALKTLAAIAHSPLRDPLDGGFFRRSVDAAWRLPSLQKVSGEQARMALAYLEAAKVTGDKKWNAVARDALLYLTRRLSAKDGGFIHAEDATLEEATQAYAWNPETVRAALGNDAAKVLTAFRITDAGTITEEDDPSGKWKGRTLLAAGDADNAALRPFLDRLLTARDTAARPLNDTNRLVSENGLILYALTAYLEVDPDPTLKEAGESLAKWLAKNAFTKEGAVTRLVGSDQRGTAEDALWLAGGLAAWLSQNPNTQIQDSARKAWNVANTEWFDTRVGRYVSDPLLLQDAWIRPLPPAPLPGDGPSAEAIACLVHKPELGELPQGVSAALFSELNDPAGQPRGDVLLAAARLLK